MSNQYDVILTGDLIDQFQLAEVIVSLATLFNLPPERAKNMLQKAPKIIKKGADERTAHKFKQAIEKVGAVCILNNDAYAQNNLPESQYHKGAPIQPPKQQLPKQPPSAAHNTEKQSRENPDVKHSAPENQNLEKQNLEKQSPETFHGYTFSIEGHPDYSFLTVQVPANETLKIEASAMATMDTHVEMKTKIKGGFGRFLTGENIFINGFKAQNLPAEIGIAPGTPGDLMHQYLNGKTIFLQNSAYVASTVDVEIETKWQGMLKGFFSGESLFLIRCSGTGDLWFNTYGAIIEIDVMDDYVVDTGNIVAFTEGLDYDITKVGGYKSLFFSGEGFVCRFSGQGKVWIQTRSAQAFASWAHWFRPVSKKG